MPSEVSFRNFVARRVSALFSALSWGKAEEGGYASLYTTNSSMVCWALAAFIPSRIVCNVELPTQPRLLGSPWQGGRFSCMGI
ncbi:uncharacterized protein BDW47DRAFT_105397, partial [Aspergillus candidus]